tara:strand:+ start:46 stop:180 length:135 start_codon:yes stop_codon:yes gene_type:complete
MSKITLIVIIISLALVIYAVFFVLGFALREKNMVAQKKDSDKLN